jgi:hypothetical protein
MLETRPGLLRNVALVSKVLGILLLIIGVIGLLAGFTAGGNMPAIVTTLLKVAALLILVTGIFFFVILYAIGDMVLVLLGIEKNTREMSEQIARSATAQATRPSSSGASRASPTPPAKTTPSTTPGAPTPPASSAPTGPTSQTTPGEDRDEVMRRATEQARRAAEIAQKSKQQDAGRK